MRADGQQRLLPFHDFRLVERNVNSQTVRLDIHRVDNCAAIVKHLADPTFGIGTRDLYTEFGQT